MLTPVKPRKTPSKNISNVAEHMPSVEYVSKRDGEATQEDEEMRALIRARVAADVEQAKRENEAKRESEEKKTSLRKRLKAVNDQIEEERLRRIHDVEREVDKQRGARRMSLNFINDLIQKDPQFIAKTWGY
jgi:hypothetical protein